MIHLPHGVLSSLYLLPSPPGSWLGTPSPRTKTLPISLLLIGSGYLYSPIRDNLGTRLPKCRFSHPWGQPGLGGQYLALQHVPKDQTSTRTSGGFSGLHIKSQTQLCVPLIPLLGRWRQKDSRGFWIVSLADWWVLGSLRDPASRNKVWHSWGRHLIWTCGPSHIYKYMSKHVWAQNNRSACN